MPQTPRKSHPVGPPRPSVERALRLLEVDSTASLDEIRAAYKRLAVNAYVGSREVTSSRASQRTLVRLTAALETLEAHLLPVSPASGASDT